MIHKIGPFAPYDSNIYLLTGDRNVIIDTGTGVFAEMVSEAVRVLLHGSKLDLILLTHCHFDHIGGTASLIAEYGSKVLAGPADAESIRRGDSGTILDTDFGFSSETFDVHDLEDGEIIDIGAHRLRTIYTPGHTAGGVSFYDEISSSLFSGDTVFANGVGRTDFPGGNSADLANSIKYLFDMSIKGLYPGHGPVTENGSEAILRGLKIVGD